MKIFTIAFLVRIWYHEAQVTKTPCPFHGFVWPLLELWEEPSIYKTVTHFRKSHISVIRILADVVFHENHKD